jgi:hypothetical protein
MVKARQGSFSKENIEVKAEKLRRTPQHLSFRLANSNLLGR